MVNTVGIIGLGLIGGSLARRLAERGIRVVAWNHRPHPYAQAEADSAKAHWLSSWMLSRMWSCCAIR